MMHQSRERFIGWQESDMGLGCARYELKGKRKNIYQKMYGKAGSNIGIFLNIKRNVNKLLKIAVQKREDLAPIFPHMQVALDPQFNIVLLW